MAVLYYAVIMAVLYYAVIMAVLYYAVIIAVLYYAVIMAVLYYAVRMRTKKFHKNHIVISSFSNLSLYPLNRPDEDPCTIADRRPKG